jgi:hypothetical protein
MSGIPSLSHCFNKSPFNKSYSSDNGIPHALQQLAYAIMQSQKQYCSRFVVTIHYFIPATAKKNKLARILHLLARIKEKLYSICVSNKD